MWHVPRILVRVEVKPFFLFFILKINTRLCSVNEWNDFVSDIGVCLYISKLHDSKWFDSPSNYEYANYANIWALIVLLMSDMCKVNTKIDD